MKMKRFLYALVLLSLSVFSANYSSAQSLGIAAIVNDDVISVFDLKSRLSLLIVNSNLENSAENRKRLSRQVLNQLVDEKLKMQEAKRLGINIPRGAVENAYRNMERRNKLPAGGLDKFLASKGIHKLTLLEQIEAGITWSRAVNRSLSQNIQIGDEEIDEIIAEMNANKGKPEYRLAEIFLPVDNPQVENDVRNLAMRIIENMKTGASFTNIARNYSQSASAAVGGDLGWVRPGQLGDEIDAILPTLEKGTLSAPVRTIAGYYIILTRDVRTGKGLSSSDEKVTLQQAIFPLSAPATKEDIAARMEEIKTRTADIKGCENLDKLAKEEGSPMSGSLGEIEVSSLPEIIQKNLAKLEIGEASAPMPSSDGPIVLMVCGRSGATALQKARKKILNDLTNERLDIAARRRLRDLRNTAFVDIRI
jgi:peptidyl-prolyl cis-trans isomerase SurA